MEEKTDISFTFEEIKEGRRIASIRFIIQKQLRAFGDVEIAPDQFTRDRIDRCEYSHFVHLFSFAFVASLQIDVMSVRKRDEDDASLFVYRFLPQKDTAHMSRFLYDNSRTTI